MRWRGIFKGLSRDGRWADFSKNQPRLSLMKTYLMNLISAGSILLDSTFNAMFQALGSFLSPDVDRGQSFYDLTETEFFIVRFLLFFLLCSNSHHKGLPTPREAVSPFSQLLCMPKAHTIIPSKIFPIIFSISSVT
jgi:hypothetical protein